MVSRDEISPQMVEKAIKLYLDLAYGKDHGTSKPDILKKLTEAGSDVFVIFNNETGKPRRSSDEQDAQEQPADRVLERFTLRLGNRNYPFMKLVLQEHIVAGEFYFAVDTHDHGKIKPEYPDYEAWVKVEKSNRELKQQIEQSFADADLPTSEILRRRVESLENDGSMTSGPLILIVDDCHEEARALEHLLRVQGYEVARAANGREALDRMRFLDPALVVLDLEMPEMDGLTLIRELRSHAATQKLPILLTSAAFPSPSSPAS